MGHELKRVQEGEPWKPSADFHNACVETIRGFRQWITGANPDRNIYNGLQVKLRNDTGVNLNQIDVVGVSGSIVAATAKRFQAQIRLSGVKPTCYHWGRIAILRHPIKAGKIGLATLSGLTVARVRLNHPDDDWAELTPDDPGTLDSQTGGGSARIICVDPGEGVRGAVVELAYASPGFGIEYWDACPGQSQPFRVWIGRWDPATNAWSYDRTAYSWAIDHRYDVPYPGPCGTALAHWKPSEEYGKIAEIWPADCSSPGCYGYTP